MPTYGSFGYGSAAYGANLASAQQTFFAPQWSELGIKRAIVNYTGIAPLYSIFIRQQGDTEDVTYRIYGHADGESPDLLQVVLGRAGISETVIGAHEFIEVEVEFITSIADEFSVVGQERFA